jgi:heme exporter protein C
MKSLGGGLLAAILIAVAGFLVVPQLITSAPLEPVMGVVQKIFYFHVPCAIMLFVATFVCAGGSIAYLFKGSEAGDRLAAAAGELGVLFGVCVLVSGPLWGRKAWGVYWQWDARLTTSLLLFLTLIAYLLARKYGGPGGKRLAAALGLFAAVNVPLV